MDGEFESLQTNSYIQKEKAQRKNPCAFSGAEGETRTLAPVARPTPLAGAPRHQLEYFSRLVSAMLFISFSQKVEIFPDPLAAKEILWRRGWDSNPRLLRVTSFQD